MANPVIHIELLTADAAKGEIFYTSLFDWQTEALPVPDSEPYPVVKSAEGPNIGFFSMPAGGRPYWLSYIRVDDIKTSVAKAKALGATVVEEIAEFGDYGWSSVIADPEGAVFAIWQYRENTAEH